MITYGIVGTSNNEKAKEYDNVIRPLVELFFEPKTPFRLISGGYGGVMESTSKYVRELSAKYDVHVETYGVVFLEGYTEEDPNEHLTRWLAVSSLSDRVHAILESSDVLIALPGNEGTFHEILSLLEAIKYDKSVRMTYNDVYIHTYWKPFLDNLISSEAIRSSLHYFDEVTPRGILKRESIGMYETSKNYEDIHRSAKYSLKEGSGSISEDMTILVEELKAIVNQDLGPASDLLGMDFSYRIEYPGTERKIDSEYISKSEDTYRKLLDAFIEESSSITYTNSSFFLVQYLDNCAVHNTLEHKDVKDARERLKTIRKPILNLMNPTAEIAAPKDAFGKWNSFLRKNEYGQTSMWLSRSVQVDGVVCNLSSFIVLDTKVNKIIVKAIGAAVNKFISTSGIKFLIKKLQEHSRVVEKFQLSKRIISNSRHTIRNFDVRDDLEHLETIAGHIDGVVPVIDRLDSVALVRAIATEEVFVFGEISPEKTTIGSPQFATVNGIIKLIASAYIDKPSRKIELDEDLLSSSICSLSGRERNETFTIIFNLFSNLNKHSPNGSLVKVRKITDAVIIDFVGESKIDSMYVNYVNQKNTALQISDQQGLFHIVEAAKRISRFDVQVFENNGETIFSFKISKK